MAVPQVPSKYRLPPGQLNNPCGRPRPGVAYHAPFHRNLRGHRRPALAAFEALLLFIVCAAALALLAGHIENTRTAARRDLAIRQLALLREALDVYYLDQGDFPPGRLDQLATDAWTTLRAVPSSAKVLAGWPGVSHIPPTGEPADPWRQPYRYFCAANHRTRYSDNGCRPVFASTGPDRRSIPANARTEIDDLASDSLLLPSDP